MPNKLFLIDKHDFEAAHLQSSFLTAIINSAIFLECNDANLFEYVEDCNSLL